jgi:flagellar basal-body rod protein FlgF
MFTGLYTAASGILSHQREIDTIGNNLVNADTPGYRADRVVLSTFEKELMTRIDGSGANALGAKSGALAAVVDRVETCTDSGTLSTTGRTLDTAIGGEGYFTVQGTDGNTYYTRNGGFTLDAEGCLSIEGLGRVQGTAGAIRLASADGVTIDQSGNVYNAQGGLAGTLRISAVPANTTVQKLDNGAFSVKGGGAMQAATGYQVYQGMLELSNIDQNQEMALLIRSQRAFQTCSSALQIADSMDQKAAAQIASV